MIANGNDELPNVVEEIGDTIGTEIGGKPGSHKWEIVTALFGWVAAFSLVGYLISHIAGFPTVAAWAFSVFGACIGIALKRDLIKILWTARISE